ncbi:MAG: ferredoxin-type protein NapG [Desulfuromonadia bacterium]
MSDDHPLSRRDFMKGLLSLPVGVASAVGVTAYPFIRTGDARAFLLRPPGAVDERRFVGACVRCGKCAQVCPFGAIRIADATAGVSIGTPYIVPREEPCQLCPDLPCVKACPSGALDRQLTDVEKVRMGTAVIVDRENCLSIRGLRCEVCYRNCPLIDRAITIEPRHNDRTGTHTIMEPVVHKDKCVGCGICEKSCVREKPVIVVQRRPPALSDYYEF